MPDVEITTLSEVLTNSERYSPACLLYLPQDEVWQLSTRAAAIPDPDKDVVDDYTPPLAREQGLAYALGVSELQSIVRNARQQIDHPTPDQLLEAFLFYYDNDAFIEFEER